MHILKSAIPFIIISSALVSCKPGGALTPEDAFNELKDAYAKKDVKAIARLLSRDSRQKIEKTAKLIALMDETQLKIMSEKFGVSVDRLKNLTVEDYMSLQIIIGERIGEDVLKEITQQRIVGKDVRKEKAVLKVESGMELRLIKEGPYWKLDTTEL